MDSAKYVIIVAGGAGSRMRAEVPKQFLELCGLPMLMHTIKAFEDFQTTVVLSSLYIDYWRELCARYGFVLPHQLVAGGSTRFESVKNGLSTLSGDGLVAIHDGVRPLVSRQTILGCFREAAIHGCAAPAIPVVDSVREISEDTHRKLNRDALRLIQTPQTFRLAALKQAI